MPAKIKLEINIAGNDKDLNNCHPYCNFLHTVDGQNGVLCRLFRIEKYLKPDFSGPSIEFRRCDKCIAAQVEVHAWADDPFHLLPCPFCGGDAGFGVSEDHDNGEYVQCRKCLTSTALVYPIMEDAKPILAEKWNRRA